MAKLYNSDDVTLKIESLRRKEHLFYEEGKDEPVGKIEISRKEGLIKLMSYEKHDERLYEKIAHCYNNFINDNPKFGGYELLAGWLFSDRRSGPISMMDFPFDIHAIKKDLNAPINLITKKQMDMLDENKIPYYSVYNNTIFRNISHKNENILTTFDNSIYLNDMLNNESLKNHTINIYSERVDYRSNSGTNEIPYIKIKDSFRKSDENMIYLPKVNILHYDESGNIRYMLPQEKTDSIGINEYINVPFNLSNINARNIYLRVDLSKENLLKSLETLEDKEDKKIFVSQVYSSKVGLPFRNLEIHPLGGHPLMEFDCNEVINELKKQSNELSLDK